MAGDVIIASKADHWRPGMATNSTASSFAATLITAIRPAASVTKTVFDRQRGDTLGTLAVLIFGTATNNQTGSVKVIGWNRDLLGQYSPEFVCEVLATFSSTLLGCVGQSGTGVAFQVLTTMLVPDTLSLTAGIAVLRQGTGDIDTATFLCDVAGFELVEVQYKVGSCTDLNVLARFQ